MGQGSIVTRAIHVVQRLPLHRAKVQIAPEENVQKRQVADVSGN